MYFSKRKIPASDAGIFRGHYRRFFAAFFVAFFATLRFFAAIYDVKIYFSWVVNSTRTRARHGTKMRLLIHYYIHDAHRITLHAYVWITFFIRSFIFHQEKLFLKKIFISFFMIWTGARPHPLSLWTIRSVASSECMWTIWEWQQKKTQCGGRVRAPKWKSYVSAAALRVASFSSIAESVPSVACAYLTARRSYQQTKNRSFERFLATFTF